MNWAIWQGRTKTGLTIFWPDKGIDTGPILLQRECEIGHEDTLGSLYFNRLFPMGVEAIAEAVKLVRIGTAPRVPQDHSKGTYEPIAKEEHAMVRWDLPAQVVYNIIRGANPQPGAWTTHNGSKLKLFDCRLVPSESVEKPGTVLATSKEGILISSWGGALLLQRVQPAESGKLHASEYAASSGLAAGVCLGD
jgi:methionyl-tRNA formyltransferase